jgi:hypothetical protein
VARFGQPFKQTFFYNADSTLTEVLCYKENIYPKTQRWHELNTVFHFKNERLVSMDQEEERRYYSDSVMVVKQQPR